MHRLSSSTAPPSSQLWELLSSHPPTLLFARSPPSALHYILYGAGAARVKNVFPYHVLFSLSLNARKSFLSLRVLAVAAALRLDGSWFPVLRRTARCVYEVVEKWSL